MPTPSPLLLPLHSLLVSGLLTRRDCESLLLVCRTWRTTVSAVVYGAHSLLLYSDVCRLHVLPRAKERPERLDAVLQRLFARFPWLHIDRSLPPATDQQLQRVHTQSYLHMVCSLSEKVARSMTALDACERDTAGGCTVHTAVEAKKAYLRQFQSVAIGDDMSLMRHSLSAARVAAGGACRAVDRVLQECGPSRNAFCVVRPPGHHAAACRTKGFCVFNNVAVAAFHAMEQYHLSRVVIVDLDVHHGNGTQEIIEHEPRVLYLSMHQRAPWFPNSGFAGEMGPFGNIVNVPLRGRSSAQHYRAQFSAHVLPRLRTFCPQLVLVSMGFDGAVQDPMGELRLDATDFYWLTNELCRVAWQCCEGKLVSVLEGGYHLGALADGAEQHVQALLHGSCRPDGLLVMEKTVSERK
ncbi:unnamed protein product [Hyaloperonospora brassicae]|uniref:histone deacetylase n=1 Tax=Hyaloperonospora brassicae TaxID=162125 RepID=A0AAV0TRG1_HYABA|nr:unnamed protein product [Hyaloperonospora brassicae]